MCNQRLTKWEPITLAQWLEEERRQAQQDEIVIREHFRQQVEREASRRMNLPAWIFTCAGLTLAGLCFLAKWLGIVR